MGALSTVRGAFAEAIVGFARNLDPGAFPQYPSHLRNIPAAPSPFALQYPHAASSIPIIYACIDMLSADGASLPVKFYRTEKGGKRVAIDPEPDNVAGLWERCNPTQSRLELTIDTQTSLDTGGMAYLFIEKYGQDRPSKDWELWGMPSHVVKPIVGDHRQPIGFEFSGGDGPVELPAKNVVYFRYWHPQFSPLGLSPLESARIQYETRYLSGRWNREFYARGAQSSGAYTIDGQANLKAGEIEQMQKRLMQQGGLDKAFAPLLLQGVKFERRGLTHQEMGFIESAALTDADICRIYGIPPVMMGIKNSGGLSDAGASTDLLRYWEYAQKKRARLRDAVVTKQLCSLYGPEFVCETDFSGVPALQKQLLEQIKAIVIATGRPIMTVNEGRLPVSWLEPIDDDESADELYVPKTAVAGAGGAGLGSAADEPTDGEPVDTPEDMGTETPPKRMRMTAAQKRVVAKKRASAMLARYERKFQRAMRAFFTHQEERVIERVRHAYQLAGIDTFRGIRVSNGTKRSELGIDFSTILGPDDTVDVAELERIFSELIEQRGEEQLAELGVEIEVELSKAIGKRYAERYAADAVTQTSETTRDRLRAALADVLANGGTFKEASDAVHAVFEGRRANADTIARTEMSGAFNFASMNAAKQSGVVTGKSWLTAMDEEVRDAHRGAEAAGTIPIDQPWLLPDNEGNATPMDFPSDPDAPPELRCNCRCTTLYTTDDERVRQVKDAFRRTGQRRVAALNVPIADWLEPVCPTR